MLQTDESVATQPKFKKRPSIAVTLQKGGVGKTTTTINLAHALACKGYQVLVVDLDPQSNTTAVLLGQPATNFRLTTLEFLVERDPESAIASVQKTRFPNISLIPSHIRLARADSLLASRNTNILSKRLAVIADAFDILIFDTPPQLGRLMLNSLAAATHYLIPVKGGDVFALDGVSDLFETVDLCRDDNPELKLLGAFLNMHDGRKKIDQSVAQFAGKLFGEQLLKTTWPESVNFQEANALGQSMLEKFSDSAGGSAVTALACEIEEILRGEDA